MRHGGVETAQNTTKLRQWQQNTKISQHRNKKRKILEKKNSTKRAVRVQRNTIFTLFTLQQPNTHTNWHTQYNKHDATPRNTACRDDLRRSVTKKFRKKKNEKRKKMFSTRSTPYTHNCATLSPVEQWVVSNVCTTSTRTALTHAHTRAKRHHSRVNTKKWKSKKPQTHAAPHTRARPSHNTDNTQNLSTTPATT